MRIDFVVKETLLTYNGNMNILIHFSASWSLSLFNSFSRSCRYWGWKHITHSKGWNCQIPPLVLFLPKKKVMNGFKSEWVNIPTPGSQSVPCSEMCKRLSDHFPVHASEICKWDTIIGFFIQSIMPPGCYGLNRGHLTLIFPSHKYLFSNDSCRSITIATPRRSGSQSYQRAPWQEVPLWNPSSKFTGKPLSVFRDEGLALLSH